MTPCNEKEIAELIASRKEPLIINGGGTRPIGLMMDAEILAVTKLSGVSRYEPEALTMVAGSGTPLAEIEDVLLQEKQRLAFEPMDHRGLLGTSGEPTIGGVVAANVSGPRRIQAGACRDYLLGVRFVDGRGQITKNGGRVMKNVTGYDLVRLLAGSYGNIGILSEISFKVLPDSECTATLVINDLNLKDAISALSTCLGSPYEITGAFHDPGINGHSKTMVRIEGFVDSVHYRIEQLKKILNEFNDIDVEMDPDKNAKSWRQVKDVYLFHEEEGDVWKISVKPSDSPFIASKIQEQIEAKFLFDWGGGLIWALVAEATNLRSLIGPFNGHATLIRASSETKMQIPVFHPQPYPLQQLEDKLKSQFDPRGILNPRFIG